MTELNFISGGSAPPYRLLILGGSGFIGQNAVKNALQKGWRVTSISRERQHWQNHPLLEKKCVDLTKQRDISNFLSNNKFDYVIDCSGYVNHSPLHQKGRRVLTDQVTSLLNIIEFLDRETLKCFLTIGSSDEYGDTQVPQFERYREHPIAPYSLGKVFGTHLIQMLHRTEQFPGVALRLFLTYGPNQNIERFVPQIIKGCLSGKDFPVSEGKQLRDLCFIDDVVEAIFAALLNPQTHGHVINIGSGHPVEIRSLINKVVRLIGQGKPKFGALPYRPGEPMELFPDLTKASELLNWRAQTSLDSGLEKTIQAFLP